MKAYKSIRELKSFFSGPRVLINEVITLSANNSKSYSVMSLLGEDSSFFTLDSLEATALMRDVDSESDTFTYYIDKPSLCLCAIADDYKTVVIHNLDTVSRTIKVNIKISISL